MSGAFYDEIEIEDLEYSSYFDEYSYPCPCGDRFRISRADLLLGERIARCPSCALLIWIVGEPETQDE